MNIDWTSIVIAVGSALLTTIIHRLSTAATPTTSPTPSPSSPVPSQSGGLFHGGLLHRLTQGGSGSNPASASATGHPILDSIVSMMQSVVMSNPSLLTSLQGVLVQLATPNGNVNLNLSNSGGTNNASPNTSAPAVSAAAVAAGS